MSPHCVWIVTVGGALDTSSFAEFPFTVMQTELGKYNINTLFCFTYKTQGVSYTCM